MPTLSSIADALLIFGEFIGCMIVCEFATLGLWLALSFCLMNEIDEAKAARISDALLPFAAVGCLVLMVAHYV